MVAVIGESMLAALGGAHTLENVRKARAVLRAANVTEVELHPLEVEAIREARTREAAAKAHAESLLAAGPLPLCRCTIRQSDGLVTRTNGCKLGHNAGIKPDEVK